VTASRQFARQFPVPASQVQYGFIPLQLLQYAADSWLEAMARRRKRVAETGVKIPINFN
jgi:hypothetical protein